MTPTWDLRQGDALELLRAMPDESAQTCVTSPPYWGLRDYGIDGQLGLEPTPAEYVEALVPVFDELRRVLRGDGTLWLNLGDTHAARSSGRDERGVDQLDRPLAARQPLNGPRHAPRPPGFKDKDLVGIPWRVAFALQEAGWWLRSEIIWHKLSPMPESVKDRPTRAHEQLFLLAKSKIYYYDADAIAEPAVSEKPSGNSYARSERLSQNGRGQPHPWTDVGGTRNKRTVWTLGSQPFSEAHFATFPSKLVEPCILAGSAPGDLVIDPFAGAATTGLVALSNGRSFIGIELNPEYCALAERRIAPHLRRAQQLGLDVA